MRFTAALMAILVIASSIVPRAQAVYAQNVAPWPPDPKKLFAKGIEVIESKMLNSPPPPSQTPCGRLAVDEKTQVALIKKGEQFYICELATGKLSQAMPAQAYWDYADQHLDGYELSTSPDGKWTWFDGYVAYVGDVLFAYERATGKLVQLGEVPHSASYHQHFGWASNTELYFTARDDPEWSFTYAYVANVSVENSLKLVMTNMRWSVRYFDNPPRFESSLTPSNDEAGFGDIRYFDCTLSIYDFGTRSTTTYHYGNLCIPEYGDEHAKGYYREVQADGKVWIVRYNPVTHEHARLYHGEVERIYWVSDDEAYALIVLDNSGKIECRPGFEYIALPGCLAVKNPVITLVDLKTGRELYHTPGTPDATWHADFADRVVPLDARSFAFLMVKYESNGASSEIDFLIQIKDGHVIRRDLVGSPLVGLDNTHFIMQVGDSNSPHYLADYDAVAHSFVPITNPTQDYRFRLEKPESGTVIIHVLPVDAYGPKIDEVLFTVKIPMTETM